MNTITRPLDVSLPAVAKDRGTSTGTSTVQVNLNSESLNQLIDEWLAEDFGSEGDITAIATIPESSRAFATLYVKQPCVLAGLFLFERILRRVDSSIEFEALTVDGSRIEAAPTTVARMEGPSRGILAAERTALNMLQRLSGIATTARLFSELAKPAGIKILDTRKTTPGLRALEKWAVLAGGGTNHRFGLYDRILIKDNHIAIAGGVTEAMRRARTSFPKHSVEIEVTNFEQLEQALLAGADTIMLDNMPPDMVRSAVAVVDGRAFIEVSGGVNQDNIRQYLIPGVDAISIGALTHSVRSIDISLEVEEQ